MNLIKFFVRVRVLIGCYIFFGLGIFWEFFNLFGLGFIRGGDIGFVLLSFIYICFSLVS